MSSHESPTSVMVSIASDTTIAVVKIIAAVASGSSAMLSEAVHSVVDSLNSIFLLVGVRASRRPPNAEHPLGHGRELYFWTLLVAMSMFAGGGAVSIYEGVTHLATPEPPHATMWTYGVLAASSFFEAWATIAAYREYRGSKRRHPEGLWATFRATRDITTFVVMFENAVALMGVVIAFAGILLSQIMGQSWPDAVASLLIGALLVAVAVILIRETKGLLIGEAIAPLLEREMRAVVCSHPDVHEVIELVAVGLGPRSVLLAMSVAFHDGLTNERVVVAIDELERTLRERRPDMIRVFIRPVASRSKSGKPEQAIAPRM